MIFFSSIIIESSIMTFIFTTHSYPQNRCIVILHRPEDLPVPATFCQPVSAEVVHCIATKTLPPSLRIIVALLFVASAASAPPSLPNRRYQYSEVDSGFHFLFLIVLLSHLRQSASPTSPPFASLPPPPTRPVPTLLNIHSVPHHHHENTAVHVSTR